jgi:hypothetical protein
MRLPATLLVLWVALIGAVAPALACAKPQTDMDCCPPDAPADCRIAWSFDRAEGTAAVTRTLSVQTIEIDVPHADNSGSSDVSALPAAPFQFTSNRCPRSLPNSVFASDFLSDATLTYLHTGRLRL